MDTAPTPRSAARADTPTTRPFTLVTGGSEGIGLAIAMRMARRGRNLLLAARRPGPLEAAAAAIRARRGVEVATIALDLALPDAPGLLDARLGQLGGHVEVLVNNAGIGHCGEFAEAGPDLLDRLLEINVGVPQRLMRHVLPGMRQRGRGGILNVASLGGYVPGPYQAAYYASRAYLISLSEAVAAEVHASGVRVTVVVPGPVETAFHAKMMAEQALYRRLIPAASPESVAAWAVTGFELRARVVVPGILNLIGFAALRLAPHRLIVPVMAALLHPRRSTARGEGGDV